MSTFVYEPGKNSQSAAEWEAQKAAAKAEKKAAKAAAKAEKKAAKVAKREEAQAQAKAQGEQAKAELKAYFKANFTPSGVKAQQEAQAKAVYEAKLAQAHKLGFETVEAMEYDMQKHQEMLDAITAPRVGGSIGIVW